MFQVLATIQGLGLVVGLLAFLWWRDGGRWRRLAAAYPVPAQPGVVHDTRRRRTVILRSRGGLWNRYLGTVTVDISEWGVTLRLMAPWAAFHPPVFVPAAEVVMQPSSWYLIGESWALTLPRVPDLSIIVTEDDWFSPVTHRRAA